MDDSESNLFVSQQESNRTERAVVVRQPGFWYELVQQAGERVDINRMAIRDYEMKEIAAALKEPTCKAKHLQLNRCNITDNSLRILTNALRNNATVEVVDLRNNSITKRGAQRVEEVLFVNETLQELHLGGNQMDEQASEVLESRVADIDSRLSPFRKWLKRNRPKASLLAEITYAQDIYIQAEDPHGTYDDPAVIQSQLEDTPLLDRLDSSKGISVDWFVDVFCQTPFLQALMKNGCQLWFLRKVGVNEMLRRLGIHAGPLADHVEALSASRGSTEYPRPLTKDTATVFVSYTGRFLLRHFVDLLATNLRGEYMWMDVFCVDQFAWTGKKNSKEVNAFSDKLIENLPEQIRGIGRVVLLLERWNDVPYTLQQAWVLWEIYNTVGVDSEFSILMTKEEEEKFISCIDHGERDEIQEVLGDVKCQVAHSDDPKATESILANMMKKGFYNVDKETIEQMRQWYQKAGKAYLQSLEVESSGRLRFVNNFAILLRHQGNLTEAEPLYQEAMEARRRVWGNNHPNTLDSINNCATLLHEQGKLTEAEPLYHEALEAQRWVLGNNHPDTLRSINNCAILLHDQGKWIEAEPLHQEALEARRLVLGNDHPETLGSINNYANLLFQQGNLTEAEPLHQEALEARRRVLGNYHPNTLDSINNCATLLQDQGKLTEAEPLYREALEARRLVLGNDHPKTLGSINNYANLLFQQGNLTEAEPLHKEALEARRRVLGNDHPDTLDSVNNYANLLRKEGKLKEAELLYQEALEARRRVLGNDHPDTLGSINNYADLLRREGKMIESEHLLRESLEARRRVLGNDHPDTLGSINNYAILLRNQSKLKEAELLFQEALEARRRVLGYDHPDTLSSISHYAALFCKQGKMAEAETLYHELLKTSRQVLGNDHPDTLDSINNYASLLEEKGQLTEAEPLYQKALEARRRVLGNDHLDTLVSILNYANLLRKQGKLTEAEPLCFEATVGFQRFYGDDHPLTKWAITVYSALRSQKRRQVLVDVAFLC